MLLKTLGVILLLYVLCTVMNGLLQAYDFISFVAPFACHHSTLASTRFCLYFAPSSPRAGHDDNINVIEDAASAILDRLTRDARNTAAITPIDMTAIRLAVDDMVTLINSHHGYQSGDLLANQLRNLTKLIANAAVSMGEVRTKVDVGVDRILAKSALVLKFSVSIRMTGARTGGQGVAEDQSVCILIEGDTGARGCAPRPPANSQYDPWSAIQQASSLFTSILVDFAPLVKKAKDDAMAMEECLLQIHTMLVQEKIIATSELHHLSSSILTYLGAHKESLGEMERRERSIDALLSARRDILSYMYATTELLDQLSSDIREIQELVATVSNPSAHWEEDFLAVVSSSSHRMRLNRVMQRNAVDTHDLPALPPSTASS